MRTPELGEGRPQHFPFLHRQGVRGVGPQCGHRLRALLADAIDGDSLPQVWVLELSSFQLDEAKGFEPDAAAVLNLTEDHLDWHGSMENYAAAKARVWGREAVMVVNRDDPRVEALARSVQPADIPAKGAVRS